MTIGRESIDRILDFPFRIRSRGLVKIGTDSRIRYRSIRLQPGCELRVGDSSLVMPRILFDHPGAIVDIGSRTFIGPSTIVSATHVAIGNDVLVSWGCTIVDHDSHSLIFDEREKDVVDWIKGEKDWSNVARQAVVIEDKVWVGFNAIILKGVTVGEGAVIAAGSVVTKDVAPWTVVGGNPARQIRELQSHGE